MVSLPWCRDMMQAIKRFSGNTRLKLNAVNTNGWVACCPHPDLNMQLWILIIICNVRANCTITACGKLYGKHGSFGKHVGSSWHSSWNGAKI